MTDPTVHEVPITRNGARVEFGPLTALQTAAMLGISAIDERAARLALRVRAIVETR
jgi:hypothetical protein